MDLLKELLLFKQALKEYKNLLGQLSFNQPLPDGYQSGRESLLVASSHLVPQIKRLTNRDESLEIYEFGKPRTRNMWEMGLRNEYDYRTEEAIDACIDNVTVAIGNLKTDIEMGIRDEQGNSIEKPPKDTAELPVNLFDKMQFHPRVIEVSESLFKTGNYSSAIFEAFKAVHNYVQDKTGLTLDGVNLMEKVFNENKPILQLNELLTKSDRDEQKGFKYLFMGSQMGIRNPPAHENVKPEEQNIALEYVGIASLLMRRIDGSKLVKLNI